MNYKEHYEKLITKRGYKSPPLGYFELHHIIPRCMGGDDSEANLVYLCARSHFIAHLLLERIHKIPALSFAVLRMKTKPDGATRNINSHSFKRAKEVFSSNHPMKNPETVAKMLSNRDYQNPDYLQKLSESHNTETIRDFRREYTTANNPMKDPENVAKMKKSLLESENTGEDYLVHQPDGKLVFIKNLRRYCREIGLPERSFFRSIQTGLPNCHGYTVFKQ